MFKVIFGNTYFININKIVIQLINLINIKLNHLAAFAFLGIFFVDFTFFEVKESQNYIPMTPKMIAKAITRIYFALKSPDVFSTTGSVPVVPASL